MRIVLDGTVGAGKTTLIAGISQRNPSAVRLSGLADLGCPIFTDWIIDVIADMRKIGFDDPSDNWNLFFDMAFEKGVMYYEQAVSHKINFYDRGIIFLEVMAKRYNICLPKKYFDYCAIHRYDNPVFILEPILSISLLEPHPTDNRQKIYTREQRIKQHKYTIDLYKRWGYDVIVLPLTNNSIVESHKYRLNLIKRTLGI